MLQYMMKSPLPPRQMNLDEDIIHQRVNELLIYLNIQHLQNRPSYHLSGGEQKKWLLLQS